MVDVGHIIIAFIVGLAPLIVGSRRRFLKAVEVGDVLVGVDRDCVASGSEDATETGPDSGEG